MTAYDVISYAQGLFLVANRSSEVGSFYFRCKAPSVTFALKSPPVLV